MRVIQAIISALLAFAILGPAPGCYSPNKARNQFAKAVTYDPALAATYCGITFPVKEKFIPGKDSIRVDTLWSDGEIITRTVVERIRDTVYTTRYIQGNTIRETIIRTDTVIKENTASVEAERLNNKALTGVLASKTTEADTLRKSRNKWRMIAIGLMVVLGLGIFLKIKRII